MCVFFKEVTAVIQSTAELLQSALGAEHESVLHSCLLQFLRSVPLWPPRVYIFHSLLCGLERLTHVWVNFICFPWGVAKRAATRGMLNTKRGADGRDRSCRWGGVGAERIGLVPDASRTVWAHIPPAAKPLRLNWVGRYHRTEQPLKTLLSTYTHG